MVCSPKSCSQINRSFSSITLLAFHGMRAPCLQRQPLAHSVRNPPGLFCQPCARSVPEGPCHPPRQFVWLSKQSDYKIGSSHLLENKEDSKGQKGQSRRQNAESRRKKG